MSGVGPSLEQSPVGKNHPVRPKHRPLDDRFLRPDPDPPRRVDADMPGLEQLAGSVDVDAFAFPVAPIQITGLHVVPVEKDDAVASQLVGGAQQRSRRGDPRQDVTGWRIDRLWKAIGWTKQCQQCHHDRALLAKDCQYRNAHLSTFRCWSGEIKQAAKARSGRLRVAAALYRSNIS